MSPADINCGWPRESVKQPLQGSPEPNCRLKETARLTEAKLQEVSVSERQEVAVGQVYWLDNRSQPSVP